MKKGEKITEPQTNGHISQTQHSDPQKSSRCHLIENLRLAPR